jgi:hypothetical protein
MAGKTAKALVHSDRGAVVAGPDLQRGAGRVALVAKPLARIRANLDRAITVPHFGQAQAADGNRLHFPAVE